MGPKLGFKIHVYNNIHYFELKSYIKMHLLQSRKRPKAKVTRKKSSASPCRSYSLTRCCSPSAWMRLWVCCILCLHATVLQLVRRIALRAGLLHLSPYHLKQQKQNQISDLLTRKSINGLMFETSIR